MLLYYKVGSEKMDCVLVRFILSVIFILFEVIFFVKIYKKYNMSSKIKLVILFIYCFVAFSLIINSFYVENLFLRFDRIEDASYYYYPGYHVVKKFEYDNYGYVLVTKRNDGGVVLYFEKENGKWKLEDNFDNKVNNIELKALKSNGKLNCFNINSGKKRNSIAIFISTNFNNDNKIDIKDSLSSEIYTYNYRTLQSETYKTTISDTIIIINQKFDKDKYKIYINGNPYKIFEKKN